MPKDDLSKLMETTPELFGGLPLMKVAEAAPWLNMLIYGEPGAGKTVFAGSADDVPEMSPVLVIDVEGGTFSLRDFYPNIESVRVRSMDDIQFVYAALVENPSRYKTVVLDSLTEIQKIIMQSIMKKVVEDDPERDPEVPSIREWGKSGEQVRRVVRAFRDLECHTIFTALVDSDKDNKTGKTTNYPSLPGKAKREIPGFVDIVAYLYTVEVDEQLHRALLARGNAGFICKDRSNRLPAVTLDPDMVTVNQLIHAPKTEGETNVTST
jgi:hypothetical protein